jgi:hypothetical protein
LHEQQAPPELVHEPPQVRPPQQTPLWQASEPLHVIEQASAVQSTPPS